MGKRKADGDDQSASKTKMDIDGEESGSDDDKSLLDVDFEYFDPSPEIDFHGLKNLLRQLLDMDNQLFDLSELADMILAQPLLGTTIKCEGQESDPYAFLTVLNLAEHRSKTAIQQLTAYILARSAAPATPLGAQLETLLSPDTPAQVGLILSDRFINMPHATVPPMYSMLLEEMAWARAEGEPYAFSHYLVVSRTYTEVASTLDVEDDRPQKKKKAAKATGDGETFYFHPEDEVLQRHAVASAGFECEKQGESDSKRTFQEMGVKPRGLLMLIEGEKLEGAVKAVGEYLAAEA